LLFTSATDPISSGIFVGTHKNWLFRNTFGTGSNKNSRKNMQRIKTPATCCRGCIQKWHWIKETKEDLKSGDAVFC